MSSINKSTSINVSDIPCFTGRNFQAWKDKMVGVLMISKVYNVVKGEVTKPDNTMCPKMPGTPASLTEQMTSMEAEKITRFWTQFNVQMNYYNTQLADYNHCLSAWKDRNSQAMGIFNQALDIGIWDQVKEKTATNTWKWLGECYAKSSIMELLEHFQYIKDYQFDLSNPSPQLPSGCTTSGPSPKRW